MVDFNIRKPVFWVNDAFNGGEIRRHYMDIKQKMESESAEVSTIQLEKLLEHAKTTTEFYSELNKKKPLIHFEDFPIVTKLHFKETPDKFISSLYSNKRLHKMSTSGSTGTPLTVVQDISKRRRNLADIIYFNEICGQIIGQKYIFCKVWTSENGKSKLEQFKQNLIPVDILSLDEPNLEKIRQILKKDKTINSMLAYASTYEQLVNYLANHNDTPDMFNIKVAITGAAVLDMTYKKRLKEIMGCRVIDRYSNQENGIIAQTNDLSEEFIVNTASYYVELLKIDSDEEVEVGEVGRIVVTDLYNFAMPIIRYDTGDLGIKTEKSYNGIRKITSIQGRQVDIIYDTKGAKLTSHTWSVYMRRFNKLKQYQFIQEDRNKYVLKVNGAEGIYTKEEFLGFVKGIIGEDANVDIQFVDSIPVLQSGKYKHTICNYNPIAER